MSIEEFDSSPFSGRPRNLFLFTMGKESFAYAQGRTDPVTHLGRVFQPEVIAVSGYNLSLAEGTPEITIDVYAQAEVVRQFVAYQPREPMEVVVFRYHEGDPIMEYRPEIIAEVISHNRDEDSGLATITCALVSSKFEKNIPWPVYQKPCNRAVYTPSCGVNKENFRLDGQIASVSGANLVSPVFATKPDGWLRAGFVVNQLGEARFIVGHVGNTITLQSPFLDAEVGMDVTAYAGCDLSRGTCKTKFNNFPRWLGFAWVPGKNPFTSNVFGADPRGGN
ncbi:putative FAD/FMN dehydrogenase [Xanthomonas phage FoX4]|uniref:Putative FAD/FMN dehydrogenase n=1 Tax=Xanthomonas phage FoX4 TaxID=2723900 RepID=A0A858XBG4_9CAUD|nr:tail assembly protein [Xanthomonas phage FoX4]QJI52986.1 putative FAD/FMN dehydrogenase [Xanthomonas phage FoX4]